MASPDPDFSAMLICDAAIREEGTGKVSLIGIFANISAFTFPTVHPKLTVYVNITDAEGPYKVRLEMTRVADQQVLGRGEMEIDVADRTRPTEILFEIGPLMFDRSGRYEFRFYANDRHVGGKSFNVVQIERLSGDAP